MNQSSATPWRPRPRGRPDHRPRRHPGRRLPPRGERRIRRPPGPGRIGLRVHERGAGETRACGTGACAAVAAIRNADRKAAADSYLVGRPGGRLRVAVLPDDTMYLTGPAAIVAQGTIRLATLAVDTDVTAAA
ncbi:hypothetical protein ACIP88_35030 [Streptomyces uncialis]|uniref:hypothetical protein n=1 Tax=Streptomyces uncialis TaxID=1048205 RepID=UPI0037FE536F